MGGARRYVNNLRHLATGSDPAYNGSLQKVRRSWSFSDLASQSQTQRETIHALQEDLWHGRGRIASYVLQSTMSVRSKIEQFEAISRDQSGGEESRDGTGRSKSPVNSSQF